MSFNIVIKADASQAEASIAKVGDQLRGVEQAAPAATGKLRDGMRESAEASKEAGEAVHGMGVEIEGSLSQSVLGRFGEFGTLLQGLASSSAIEAAAVVGVGAEIMKLGDEYTELGNRALRLAGSTENVNATLQQQMELSREMHASLEQTLEASTLIKERTDSLGYSQITQTQLTKELSQASILSGRAAGDAAQAFGNLGFMLEEHLPAGRQMKQLMLEFPPIAEALKEHFRASGEEIVKMAQQGTLEINDLVAAMNEHSAEMEQKMAGVHETLGESMGHLKDEMTLTIGKAVESTGVIQSLGEAFRGLGLVIQASLAPLEKLDELLGEHGNIKGFVTSGLLSNLAKVSDMFGPQAASANTMAELAEAQREFAQKQQELAGMMKDSFMDAYSAAGLGEQAVHRLGDSFSLYLSPKVKEAKVELTEEEKLVQALNKPMDDLIQRQQLLGLAYDDNKIHAFQYNIELEKVTESIEKLNAAQMKLQMSAIDRTFGGLGSGLAEMGKHLGAEIGAYGPGINTAAEAIGSEADKERIKNAEDMLKDYNKQVEETKRVLEAGFRPLGEQLVKLAESGKFSWSEMTDSIISDLIRMEAKWLEMKAIGFLQGEINGPSPADQATNAVESLNLLAFAHGGDVTIPHAASGYAGTVGGFGGTDSQLFMARVTPGEHVSIRTPEQMAAQQQAAAPAPTYVNVGLLNDRDAMLRHMASPEGKRIIIDLIRQYGR